jgi:hypothetical protein
MTYRLCRAPGCSSPAASSFAAYCSPHKANLRRHGAVDQKAITKTHLKPYLKLVRERISKNPDSPAWVTLDSRWRALVDHAQGLLAQFSRGRAMSRFEITAAREVVKLAAEVKPREVVEVTCAVVVMWELEPRRFRSDEAFWVQLARRVRGLTDVNFGERWDNVRGKVRRCYRELTPRATIMLGKWLAETLGVGGQHIARLQQADWHWKAKEAAELREALSKLV